MTETKEILCEELLGYSIFPYSGKITFVFKIVKLEVIPVCLVSLEHFEEICT